MSITELIDQARYGSANGYDNLDMLRESLTKPERQALLEVIEEEFGNMSDDIMYVFYSIDLSIPSRNCGRTYTMVLYEKLESFYNNVLEILNEEENYLNARLKGRDR